MKLILVRGVPGSGKSTFAKKNFPDFPVIEADDYFYQDGEYKFDPSKISDAHKDCQYRTRKLLEAGRSVVVANTFTQLWEMDAYLDLAYKFDAELVVYRCKGNYTNVHGVPPEKVKQMQDRFQNYPGEIIVN